MQKWRRRPSVYGWTSTRHNVSVGKEGDPVACYNAGEHISLREMNQSRRDEHWAIPLTRGSSSSQVVRHRK